MQLPLPDRLPHPFQYDAQRRRLWILGQRCHHGATGALITVLAGGMVAGRHLRSRTGATVASAGVASAVAAEAVGLAAFGGVLMLHDWKDHSVWFQRGRGSQP